VVVVAAKPKSSSSSSSAAIKKTGGPNRNSGSSQQPPTPQAQKEEESNESDQEVVEIEDEIDLVFILVFLLFFGVLFFSLRLNCCRLVVWLFVFSLLGSRRVAGPSLISLSSQKSKQTEKNLPFARCVCCNSFVFWGR
jgi:hypothetical protein